MNYAGIVQQAHVCVHNLIAPAILLQYCTILLTVVNGALSALEALDQLKHRDDGQAAGAPT